jgi:hypothetical protein
MQSSNPNALDLLDLDVDVRLAEVWRQTWSYGEWTLSELGALLRLAYGQGYCDALTEPERGKLCRDHGFAVPERRRA